jgi:lysophospholipase L1-like esterase
MRIAAFLLLAPLLVNDSAEAREKSSPVTILLLGDSTCIGSVCRMVAPDADHLEGIIEKLLAAEKDLPPTKVINQGRDGEFIHGLLTSGRYEKEIAPLENLDYILIRFGINDRNKRDDFAQSFPHDYRELLDRLRKDHPQARMIPMTIIPYMGAERDKEVNDIVREIAKERELTLLDVHVRYAAELKQGENMLNYRRVAVANVPDRFHALLGPARIGDSVIALDNRLDAHLNGVPGWFGDRHPNLAGYHVIGDETARFLAPLLKQEQSTDGNGMAK